MGLVDVVPLNNSVLYSRTTDTEILYNRDILREANSYIYTGIGEGITGVPR